MTFNNGQFTGPLGHSRDPDHGMLWNSKMINIVIYYIKSTINSIGITRWDISRQLPFFLYLRISPQLSPATWGTYHENKNTEQISLSSFLVYDYDYDIDTIYAINELLRDI